MKTRTAAALLALVGTLGGCGGGSSAVGALPHPASAKATDLAATKDALDRVSAATATPVPLITGTGYAAISAQPGATLTERRLMALKAARMEALADLAAQVQGIAVSGGTTLQGSVVADDNLQAQVSGLIRGARTLHITPKGTDAYQVDMAIDRDTLGYMLNTLAGKGR